MRRINGEDIRFDSTVVRAKASLVGKLTTHYLHDVDADLAMYIMDDSERRHLWVLAVEQVEPCS